MLDSSRSGIAAGIGIVSMTLSISILGPLMIEER